MKSPLLQKKGMDAFLQALNDPATTNPDDRTDKQYSRPEGKGTELEYMKSPSRVTAKAKTGFTGLWADITHPEATELPVSMRMDQPGGCPTCGGGLTRRLDENGKVEEVCTKCTYKPKKTGSHYKTAVVKPKCPHCGSTKYSLMPTDFETAKCDECGKNWDHGIVPGINDPKTASKWGDKIKKMEARRGESIESTLLKAGLVNPRPAMRHREEQNTHKSLKRHKELMDKYMAEGMTKEEASRKAFQEVTKKKAYGINVATILHDKKFAAKNAPDPGQYDEEHESHVREEAKQWAQYAEEADNTEEIKPYDPDGDYLCGTCDMRQGEDQCMRVNGPINFEKGSCRLFHLGAPENRLPMEKKFTQEEAKYSESKFGGFGCHRCEYGKKAEAPDADGRELWCSFWGMHVIPTACCAQSEPERPSQLVQIAGLQKRPDYGKTGSLLLKKKADWTMTCPWCKGTARKNKPTDDYKCTQCDWTSKEEPKAMAQHAAVEIHETPRDLPPRDDMRGHLDEEVKEEMNESIDAPVMEGAKGLHFATENSTFDDVKQAGDKSVCKHCDEEIGEIVDPWGGSHGWIHHPDDGPDAYTYCHCRCATCRGEVAWNEPGPPDCIDGDEAEPLGDEMLKKELEGQQFRRDLLAEPKTSAGLEFQRFLEPPEPRDMKREAQLAFMRDPTMQQEARDAGMSMEEFWGAYGAEYANEYFAGRRASKTAMQIEEGIKICPKCTSSNVEEVTDSETKGGDNQIRLFECTSCHHLFSL